MSAPSKHRLLAVLTLAAATVCVVPGTLLYVLIRAKADWGGSPGKQVLGNTDFIEQRAMQQYCTGVVVTPQATWLVGRVDRNSQDLPEIANLPDLSELVAGPREKAAATETNDNPFSAAMWLSGSTDSKTSILSRLNDAGHFEPVAMLPEVACLLATPDGKRLFLLTGLERPAADASKTRQLAILRSDDQGKHWQWLQAGLFPAAGNLPWNLDIHFFDSQSLWVWGEDGWAGPDKQTPATGPALLHSADGGTSVEEIRSAQPLLTSFEEIQKSRPADTDWGDSNGGFGEVSHHILQLDADHAVGWLSQIFRYSTNGHTLDQAIKLTTRCRLGRHNGHWQFEQVERFPGLSIEKILDNRDGQTMALLRDQSGDLVLATLNRQTLAWENRNVVPGAFTPLPSNQVLREWAIGQHSLVINVMSDFETPAALALDGRRHTISADAVFYTTDWGKSWHKLAIDGYLGLLGMDAPRDRVIWAKGNWYSSHDPDIYTYSLN